MNYDVGMQIIFRMDSGRLLKGTILSTWMSTSGPKYRVQSGFLLCTIRPDQIVAT